MTLLAYRGTVTKPQLLASLRRHAAADAIVKGSYWSGNGNGKGCAVGCSIHDFAPGQEGRHDRYPTLFGIPTAIAYLEDSIFESLPDDASKTWPLRFAQAIRPGADLSSVIPQFLSWLMLDETYGTAWTTTDPEIANLAAEVGYRYAANDTTGDEATDLANRLRDARAAWAARDARDAWDAGDARAARAARDAWDARDARAAWAARAARAAWAARAAFVAASADTLLEILAAAPIGKSA